MATAPSKPLNMSLDDQQKNLSGKFQKESYLSKQENVARVVNWTTFYRQNIHRFATHYLGLKLYFYQIFSLYLLGLSTDAVIVAARAAAKSFIIAIFACCKAILYPKSQIVIASSTKKQAALIVTEKIQKELMGASPNLRAEIDKFVTRNNENEIVFKNGSTITVVVGNDNARGHRSTLLILEEVRMMKKRVIDSVLTQFQHVRDTGFKDLPEYASLPSEESCTVSISSAWYRSHWMWRVITDTAMASVQDGGTSLLLAFDYTISLHHKIKTRRQLIQLKRQSDPTTWAIECENMMVGEGEHSFFSYDLFSKSQTITRPMYPRTEMDIVTGKKNQFCLPHQEGEVRILTCDIAFVDKSGNDNSAFSVVRMLPERVGRNASGYRKQIPYIETRHGGDTIAQSLRIKQLFYELECDYCVLDLRNGGVSCYDNLARVTWDEANQKEYPPWVCINDQNIADRIRSDGAKPVLFAVVASAKLNSDIAIITRREFSEGRVDLLIRHDEALDDVLPKIKEYTSSIDVDDQLFYERPYLETQAFINETIGLVYDRLPETGAIRISEQGNNTKDRYTSVSYGLYFADTLERDLCRVSGEYGVCCLCD